MAFSLSSWFKGKPSSEQDDGQSPNAVPTPEAAPAPVPVASPAAAPSAVRTVMPKSSQPVSLRDPGTRQPVSLTSAIPPPATTNRVTSVRPPGRKISFPIPSVSKPVPTAAQPVASAPVAAVPSTPAPMPEAPDVAVILEVGDFVDRLPPGFLNAGPFDRHQQIEFRASELYSDLTKGRASVPASTIYAKFPALFARPISDTEDVEVALPLQKLVEQLSAAFQTRADQVAEENVGEIETPFLQVAKEDSERLPTAAGTVAGAIRPAIPLPTAPVAAEPALAETVPGFPVRPQHRTGQISTISAPKAPLDAPAPTPAAGAPATGPINPGKRPPSTVRASVAGGKIRLSGPSAVTRMSPAPAQPSTPGAAANPPASAPTGPTTASQRIQLPIQNANPAASPSLAVTKKTARIQIPPISLRAGGPSAGGRAGAVPPPAVPVQPSPVSIRPPAGTDLPMTFRSSPPPPPAAKLPPPSFAPAPRPNFLPPAFPAIPPAAAPAAEAPAAPAPLAPAALDHRKIELGLAAVLRGIPSEALTVEPWTIADDVRFSLPFANVEKQLSLGRVSVGLEQFMQALPENYRHVVATDSGLTEIQLPLPEIFQNLPASALAIRPDQVIQETGSYYPTPFSQKADEDAERLGVPVAAVPAEPVAEVAAVSQPAEEETPVAPEAEQFQPAALVDQSLAATGTVASAADVAATEEPARDVPLELDRSSADELPLTPSSETVEAVEAQIPPADQGSQEMAPTEARAVAGALPAEPVVEPPAAVEPVPVEEALAVLEATAPVESPEEVSEPASIALPTVFQPAPVAAAELGQKSIAPSPAPAQVVAPLRGRDSVLQTLFMTEEEIDAKVVVRLVCQLPGISGCAVMFADGLRLAGNFPDGDAEGFSAMAPPFYKRTQNFVSELNLGPLKTLTVHTEKDLLSFFMHDDICVSVRHAGRGFLPGVREKLETVTREAAGMYSTAKAAPADFSL